MPPRRPQRRAMRAALLSTALGLSAAGALAAPATVRTDAGSVQGTVADTGARYLGIPFAAPPVGDLRWRSPQPVTPWAGVRDATRFGPACKQDATVPPAGAPNSSEDCLYLNVYVPPQARPGAQLPVLLWIHGGAFITGAGSQYDGSELARMTGSVVVTTNYRLGIFGFLALDALTAEGGSGNFALEDQQAAMRWVRRNIGQFGGDPTRVTLFGQSAGGASVVSQLVSPRAAGLFQRAIVESSPSSDRYPTRAEAMPLATALAAKLGCAPGAGQLACLRAQSTDQVFAAAPAINFTDPLSLRTFTPFVDGSVIPDQPKKLISQGRFNRMPVMIGNTRDEGTLFIAIAYELRRGTPLTQAEYEASVTQIAGSTSIGALAAQAILADYSSSRLGSPGAALSALLGDTTFACPTQSLARALSDKVPTYAYEFQERNVPEIVDDPFLQWGAYHASELPFIFGTRIDTTPPSPDPRSVASPAQLALSQQMMGYWGRFAAKGSPNGDGTPWWPVFNTVLLPTQKLVTPRISTDLLGGVYSSHQCLLWDTAASLGLGL